MFEDELQKRRVFRRLMNQRERKRLKLRIGSFEEAEVEAANPNDFWNLLEEENK